MKKCLLFYVITAMTLILAGIVFVPNTLAQNRSQKPLMGSKDKDTLTDLCKINCIIPTSDGNFIAVGWTKKRGSRNKVDALIVKRAPDGKLLWSDTLKGNRRDWFTSVVESEDGKEIIVVGGTNSRKGDLVAMKGETDIVIVKYDNNGFLFWQKVIGTNCQDVVDSIAKRSDGSFGIYCRSNYKGVDVVHSRFIYDFFVLRMYPWGKIEQEKCLVTTN